jgi:hypothetical protein
MAKLRFWVSAALLWLAFLLNIERLCEPINIASFVYVMAAVMVVVTAVLPLRKRWQAGALIVVAMGLFLAMKIWLHYPLFGPGLPLTLTEVLAILTSFWLGRRLTLSLLEYEKSVVDLAALHRVTRPMSFLEMQDQFYREVRRARLHDRPLSFVAVRPDTNLSPMQIDALIAETQLRLATHYQDVRFAELLSAELSDCDLIAKCNDHFVLMLAETDSQRAWDVARRLEDRVQESLGVGLRTGVATFPHEEVTLAGLIKRAESGLAASEEARTHPVAHDIGSVTQMELLAAHQTSS